MHRAIHHGVGLVALVLWAMGPAIAENLSPGQLKPPHDVSSSSLDAHRLFFSVQERKKTQSTIATPEPSVTDKNSPVSGIQQQKQGPVRTAAEPSPAIDRTIVHYQALLESDNSLRLIINGVPCEAAAVLSSQSVEASMAVDCQSAALSSVKLAWLPASRMLEVEEHAGIVRLLAIGDSL